MRGDVFVPTAVRRELRECSDEGRRELAELVIRFRAEVYHAIWKLSDLRQPHREWPDRLRDGGDAREILGRRLLCPGPEQRDVRVGEVRISGDKRCVVKGRPLPDHLVKCGNRHDQYAMAH